MIYVVKHGDQTKENNLTRLHRRIKKHTHKFTVAIRRIWRYKTIRNNKSPLMPNINNNLLSDDSVLAELGRKTRQVRLRKNLPQTALAEASGVAKRTIERFEKGASVQLTSLIRILRALGMLNDLIDFIPEQKNSPMTQLRGQKKVRSRASGKGQNNINSPTPSTDKWKWDE